MGNISVIIKFIISLFKAPPMPPIVPIAPPTPAIDQDPIILPPTPQQRLYKATVAAVVAHTDASPQDLAPDEVACMESVDAIYCKEFGVHINGTKNVPLLSTALGYQALKSNPRFQSVLTPEPGVIIVSPTGYGNGNLSNGHIGIFINDTQIASNSSATGIFTQNYTLDTWVKRYRNIGGFPIRLFKPI